MNEIIKVGQRYRDISQQGRNRTFLVVGLKIQGWFVFLADEQTGLSYTIYSTPVANVKNISETEWVNITYGTPEDFKQI